MRKTRTAVQPPPAPPTGELVKVADWEKALEALLSYSATEGSIAACELRLQQAAAQHEASKAVARKGVEEACAAAGLPSPYDPKYLGYRWDLKTKSIYRVPRERPQ